MTEQGKRAAAYQRISEIKRVSSMRIDQRHFRILPGDGFESAFAIDTLGRWVRFGLFFGEAPGSHMIGKHFTAWQTRCDDLYGWNVRAGWWPKPCVTMLLHTRPSRDRRQETASRAG